MPLLPPVLQQGLITMDDPQPGSTAVECAGKWFDAWWGYFSGCSLLNPATVPAAKLAAQGVFVPILTAALSLNQAPIPLPFFMALEGAIRAAMQVVINPLMTLPPQSTLTPSPVPLGPLLVPAAAIGMASGSVKAPPRIYIASVISGWTSSNVAILAITPFTPTPLF